LAAIGTHLAGGVETVGGTGEAGAATIDAGEASTIAATAATAGEITEETLILNLGTPIRIFMSRIFQKSGTIKN